MSVRLYLECQMMSRQRQDIKTRGSASLLGLIAVAAVLVIAISVGGGGVRYALANLAVQLSALILIAIRREAVLAFWQAAPRGLKALVVLSVAMPMAQLIPLPEAIWHALPGRELVQQSHALSGRSGWAPLSVDPIRTLVALTGVILPIAILTAGWQLRRSQLLVLGWLIVYGESVRPV